MRDLIGQVNGYAMLSWGVDDVIEISEQEGEKYSPDDAQAFLCQYENAIYEAAYYAAKKQIKDAMRLRKEPYEKNNHN